MNFFGSKQGGSLVQSAVRPLAASMAATLSVALLSACIGGGGGGDSSGGKWNLPSAYDQINGCMNRGDLINLVGGVPNDHDSDNTMIWESGDYRMTVSLQRDNNGVFTAHGKWIDGPGTDRTAGLADSQCGD